jgi:surface antigen
LIATPHANYGHILCLATILLERCGSGNHSSCSTLSLLTQNNMTGNLVIRNWQLIAVVLMISGCSATGGGGASVAPQPVSAQAAAQSESAALNGGLVKRAGITLSPFDQAKALQAEQYALTAAPAGEAVNWQGEGARGSVTAASPYQVGDQNCRQYTQRVVADGREFVGRGAACREAAGSWSLLD